MFYECKRVGEHVVEGIEKGRFPTLCDIATAYSALLIAALDEHGIDPAVTDTVDETMFRLMKVDMDEEAVLYFFKLCEMYEVPIPSKLIHLGIFGKMAKTFAAELHTTYSAMLELFIYERDEDEDDEDEDDDEENLREF